MNIGSNSHGYTVKSRLRIAIYMQMALADDIETQRRGCVGISWWQNVNIFDDFSKSAKVYSVISKCVLVRLGAHHTCIVDELDDNDYSSSDNVSPQSRGTPSTFIKSMMALSIGQKLRSKLRFHTGKSFISLLCCSLFFILILFFNL